VIVAVHDAIARAVEGRRVAREDQRAAISRMAAEIAGRAEADGSLIPPDVMHTIEQLEGAGDDQSG
jgi:hypothetical protein